MVLLSFGLPLVEWLTVSDRIRVGSSAIESVCFNDLEAPRHSSDCCFLICTVLLTLCTAGDIVSAFVFCCISMKNWFKFFAFCGERPSMRSSPNTSLNTKESTTCESVNRTVILLRP
uniref:Uncharacterized protein n=1 Tax=Vannella robusta TaxID=1487602 RepID=A0A7S4HR76_9EUKA